MTWENFLQRKHHGKGSLGNPKAKSAVEAVKSSTSMTDGETKAETA